MAKRGTRSGNGQAPTVCEAQVAAAYANAFTQSTEQAQVDKLVRGLLPHGALLRPYYFAWYAARHAPPPAEAEPPARRRGRPRK